MNNDTILRAGERLETVNERLRLIERDDGLKFGTDAYLLAAFMQSRPRVRMCELGGGTGIVSLLALTKGKCTFAHVAEIQETYCDLIARNAELNGLADRVQVLHCDVRELTPAMLPTVGTVVSNPPYMRAGSGFASAANEMDIARREVCGTIGDFVRAAARVLGTGGVFDIVYRPERLAELFSAMRENRLEPKRLVTVYPDPRSAPCLVLVQAQKDAAPSLKIAPPLCIYRSRADRTYTDETARIYDTCNMDFLFEKE